MSPGVWRPWGRGSGSGVREELVTELPLSACRYFLHGVCREGAHCQFSHDPSSSKPSTICKFYQRGTCAYGERCR